MHRFRFVLRRTHSEIGLSLRNVNVDQNIKISVKM